MREQTIGGHVIALAVAVACALTVPALYFALTRASRDAHARHRVIRGTADAGQSPQAKMPTGVLLLILVVVSPAGQGILWLAIPVGNVLVSVLGALSPVLIYGLFYALDRLILRAVV